MYDSCVDGTIVRGNVVGGSEGGSEVVEGRVVASTERGNGRMQRVFGGIIGREDGEGQWGSGEILEK